MDNINWGPAQAEPNMDRSDWRSQLQPDSRQRIVNKIMETLKRHLPISGPQGILELKKIAVRFEEKIYTAATSQSDYLRRISVKMLTMETKSQSTSVPNSLPINSAVGNQKPPDSASHSMQSQVPNQGQLPIPLPNQAQAQQQLLSQNMQNTIASAGVQSTPSLPSALPSVTGLSQTTMQNAVGQSSNMQNISGISRNSVGQGIPSNLLANSQSQMLGRQYPQQVVSQQRPPYSHQYTYQQQQLQHQILKQKLQQNLLQPASLMQMSSSLQSSQPTLLQTQPSLVQSSPPAGFQQNEQPSVQQSQSSVLQQHPESVPRQQQESQQQWQQQLLVGQQQNTKNFQQNQVFGQHNSVPDIQQQQRQQQRLFGQQNNLSTMQQQPQLLCQQNNISNLHQQQFVPQNSVTGLLQQQLLGNQSGVSNMLQLHQQSMHTLQQQAKVSGQQQKGLQTSSSLLQIQGQQSQPLKQQLLSQLQSQPAQLQQQSNFLFEFFVSSWLLLFLLFFGILAWRLL